MRHYVTPTSVSGRGMRLYVSPLTLCYWDTILRDEVRIVGLRDPIVYCPPEEFLPTIVNLIRIYENLEAMVEFRLEDKEFFIGRGILTTKTAGKPDRVLVADIVKTGEKSAERFLIIRREYELLPKVLSSFVRKTIATTASDILLTDYPEKYLYYNINVPRSLTVKEKKEKEAIIKEAVIKSITPDDLAGLVAVT